MATNRDVKLGVEVQTSGGESLRVLATDVRGVGTAAASSAPGVDQLTGQLQQLTAATVAKRDAERAARTEEATARSELNARRDALALLRAGADAATRATVEHQTAIRAERIAVIEASAALRDRRAAVAAATQEARAAAAAQREAAAQLAAGMREQTTAAGAAGTAVQTLRGQYALLQSAAATALGGTLVGSLARDLAATADEFNNLGARIRIVTGEGRAFNDALTGVEAIAQRTGASLETTGTLFTRLLQAGKEFGLAQRDALALTETITQAVQVSGASAQSADAAITQLVQGLQSGVLRGEEFNSVLEQAPRLARALAAGLNVTLGELRDLAQQGALTSRTVTEALRGQAQAIQAEYDKMPPTVERAIGRLSNAWQVYIGQTDGATGASATAARAIDALARNLDGLGNVLLGLGKAAAAYSVIRVAAGYFSATAAATTAATAAAVAHTAAVQANTAAQVTNNAAATASAASAGRLAGALGSLKLFSLAGVVANYRELGTAIGEGAAKLMGYGKVLEEAQRATQADEEAARRAADATAALAQAKQLATDKAMGLNKEARGLVAEFEQTVEKTSDTTEALGKLSKSLRLDDVSGIKAAAAALDALGQRGKLSADQIRTAMADALKGADLLQFETNARAAFDNSEQGARRLKVALDAIGQESLKRAGTSLEELQSGFSKATTSAVNDVDTLARTLRDLGIKGEDAGRALSASLDKALAAANTERAVRAVIDRIQELGRTGLLAGDRLAEGLDKAQKKLDELRPGINSLAEAYRAFGLQTRDDAQRTADKLGEAYRTIAASGTASVRDQIDAYAKWREAALKASGGVESGHLAEQRVMLENRATVAGLGDEYERAMGKAEAATRRATAALTEQRNAAAGSLSGDLAARNAGVRSVFDPKSGRYDAEGFALGTNGQRVNAGGQLKAPDMPGDWEFVSDAAYPESKAEDPTLVVNGVGYWKRKADSTTATTSARIVELLAQRARGGDVAAINAELLALRTGRTYTPTAAPAQSSAAAPAQPSTGGSRTVTINLAGLGSTSVNVASDADAARLEAMLRQLEQAAGRSGAPG